MAWTKDAVSEAPKIAYTPPGDNTGGVRRLIYDPAAPADKRWCAEFAFIATEGETLQEVEVGFGITE